MLHRVRVSLLQIFVDERFDFDRGLEILFDSRMRLAKGFFLPFRLQIQMPRTAVQARVGVG